MIAITLYIYIYIYIGTQQNILQHLRSHFRWGLTGTPPVSNNMGAISLAGRDRTAVAPRTTNLHVRGFGSSIFLILRGGIPRTLGNLS